MWRTSSRIAYELELPPTAHIHLVFHISLLKACFGKPDTPISDHNRMQLLVAG
jgi:hypothetical protein